MTTPLLDRASKRVAFVTPEYVSELGDGGGLGNYLARLCHVLVERGHRPEVFVSADRDETTTTNSVIVHRVNPERWRRRLDPLRRITRWLPRGAWAADRTAPLLAQALALAGALRRREAIQPFDGVQSADYQAVGLFIGRGKARRHVVRCSSAADLWELDPWQGFWERKAIARADAAYAPSRFVADHLAHAHGLNVGVVRPPVAIEATPSDTALDLPPKFLLHFGLIRERKGAHFLAEALPAVWRRDPSVRMVWAGRMHHDRFEDWQARWRDDATKVTYLGPIGKRDLYQVLRRSVASVLPSKVDNLPNTVIESLMCERPVIGTRRSSVDELVVDGANGLLVDYGDAAALADAILRVWHGWTPAVPSLIEACPIWHEMEPDEAVARFLQAVCPEPQTSRGKILP